MSANNTPANELERLRALLQKVARAEPLLEASHEERDRAAASRLAAARVKAQTAITRLVNDQVLVLAKHEALLRQMGLSVPSVDLAALIPHVTAVFAVPAPERLAPTQ